MARPPIVELLDNEVTTQLDRELRALLNQCFTGPEDKVFAYRRYWKEPPTFRWIMRNAGGDLIAHVAAHDKVIRVGGRADAAAARPAANQADAAPPAAAEPAATEPAAAERELARPDAIRPDAIRPDAIRPEAGAQERELRNDAAPPAAAQATAGVGAVELRIAGIAEVSVHPAARGMGHVKELLHVAHRSLAERGFDFGLLFGRPGVYRSSGYRVADNRVRYYDDGTDEWKTDSFADPEKGCLMYRPLTKREWPAGIVDLGGPKF